ncbi:hypothetical protein FBUS_01598 [Fasciolopsis buskii]|uniref:Uncharacterized protein n=1 Tax=Fasciolopsis buskii TaxID=27845 RepID=A0A8E0S8C8_9TREM|nr:hypothetical protein FBUS_01598 [Fasciolopsis buski]
MSRWQADQDRYPTLDSLKSTVCPSWPMVCRNVVDCGCLQIQSAGVGCPIRGRCQIGWAYLTTLFGAFLAIASAALPSICISHLISGAGNTVICCKLRLPWSTYPPDETDHSGLKYGQGSESVIPMVPMFSGPLDGMSGVRNTLTPCCSPAVAHHPFMGPTTVYLCSSMTPLNQQPLLTQAHSVYSQFTNTSSLGDSSNELVQRPAPSNPKE